MSKKKCYPKNQTLDGGDVASERKPPMKSKPRKNAKLFDNQKKEKGSIINKTGTKKLSVKFYYFGEPVDRSTGLDDTVQNRDQIRLWLNRQFEKIQEGTFRFAEAFPDAKEKDKEFFSKLEGWQYKPGPEEVLFGTFVAEWYKTIWHRWPEATKKDDYKQVIDYWLLPHFQDMTFSQITYFEIVKFLETMNRKKGPKAGKPLSTRRIKNILSPFRKIWKAACKQYNWALTNSPFDDINEDIPKRPAKKREGFRFDDAMKLLHFMDPWYRPIAELMLLTGMISSELAGLKKSHIRDGYIHVKDTIVRDREKDEPKNSQRIRKIPITVAIGQRLEILMARANGERLVTTPSGTVFRASNFLTDVWTPALDESELPHRVPYGLRHSFAAWALTAGIDINRLVSLMGHGSKKMVFEEYGNYIEGLAEDAWKIREFFGLDFLAPEIKGRDPQGAQWLEEVKAMILKMTQEGKEKPLISP